MDTKIDPLAESRPRVDVMNKPSGDEPIPFEVVPLPSKGKLYDEDHPLHGETSVQIKAMSNREENILHSPALVKKGTVVDELIRSCVVNKLVDPEGLLVGDKSAILTAIRITGLTKDYSTKTQCPECEKQFTYTFDLSKCAIKELQVEPTEPGKNLFDFVLPLSKTKVQFKLLTAGDEKDISNAQDARKKALKKMLKDNPHAQVSDVDTRVTDRLTQCIVSFGGQKERGKISSAVMNMRSQDSRALRKYIKDIEPDLNMTEEVTCPHCNQEEVHNIPMGIEFLWPEL